MRKVLAGLAAALLLVPAQVEAANYCAPGSTGSFMACASINVSFDASSKQLVVEVTNMDLWAIAQGYNPAGHSYAVVGFGIEAPAITGNVDLIGVEALGGATEVGDKTGWSITTNLSGFEVYTGAETDNGINGGILGCNGTLSDYFRTCAGGVNTGVVRFTFQTEMTEWAANEVLLSLRAQDPNGVDLSYRCSDDPAATNGAGCATTTGDSTVPEPVTVLLFGSGLAVIATATRRRRQDPDSD